MRILTLLLLTMVGAGQMWAETDEPSNIKRGTISGGSIAFYADEACTTSFDGDVAANATVYVKATPEPGKTAIGVTFTVKKSISSDAMQAPGRRSAPEGPGITSDIEVSAVTGKPGIYSFTMPAEGNTNVTVSATFAAPAQQQVNYVDGNGETQTVNAYVFDETMLGLSTGFYVVPDGGITFSNSFTIADDANLILKDGATMTVNGTLSATDNQSLTIYAQTAMTGQLTVATYACGVILVPHFVAYSGDYATALVAAGTVSSANVTTINGKTLKPLAGNAFTKYVPQDKSGSYTMALPALPNGASYTFTKTDANGVINTISDGGVVTELTYTTNSGTTGGTTATITVAATGATNNNDYSFTLNVIVSDYTTAYEWPEQTNIWLDADNELVWAEGGNTLDTSLLTVKKNGSAVTNYTAKVGETVLTAGENLLTLAPGAYRIAITGDDGKLDDWVDFKVIKLIENDQDLTLSVHDWTYPDLARTGGTIDWDAIVGSVKYGDTTIELSKNDISRGNGIDNESLKLWFTNADRPHGTESVFMTKEMTVEDFYYPGGTRFQITPFGSVVDVGSWNVYLPNHVTVKQLLDDDGNPVPAGDNGGKIYYMCNSRPDLHVEQSESEVGGQTVTELTLYNGDTPVTEGYYFRNGDDFYYGNGENAYKAYGGNDGFISFWPVKSYAKGTVYPMGDKPFTKAHVPDENGDPKYSDYTFSCGNYTETWESHYEARPSYNETVYVGKNYFYCSDGGFLYTGNVIPTVTHTMNGSTISFGDYQVDMGNEIAIACLPDDEIDGSQASDVWILPHAYARYKADDYHYQIADQEFIIYSNNSLIIIKDKQDVYHAGEDAEIVVELRQINRGMSVFVNGTNHRFTGYGDHTLTIPDLREGKYTIDAFGDGDDCVTSFSTSNSFTVIKTDPVLTLTGKQNTAGVAFETGADIEYDPENPIVVNAVNDKAVSGTNWKWTISNTDVVTQHHIVNESQQNAVNSEDIYLNTIGLGEVTLTARFSGNEIYNPARKSITFKVVPKNVESPIIELVDQSTIYYDGTAKEPAVKVYYAEGKEIPADQYDVTYEDNTNASTTDCKAKIIVKSVDGANYNIDAVKEFVIQETAVTITELPIASTISDGRTLAASTLTGGKAKAGELDVDGIFSWKDKTIAPTLTNSDVTEYDVTFTPNNTNFKTAECQVKLTVMPRAMLFAANSTNLWATFCGKNEYEVPEGCTAYTISSISGSTVTISEVTAEEANAPAIIPAYTPMLIQRDANVTAPVTAAFSAIVTAPTSGYDDQTGLVSTTGSDFTFYGNCSNTAVSPDDFKGHYNEGQTYLLYDGKFILADENGGLGAHKCLLVLNGTNNAPVLSIGTETTSLSPVPSPSREGSSQRWYTLDGRKLDKQPTKKGIYINGGRKVVIK